MAPVPLEIWRNAATVASASIALAAFFRPELQKLFARFRGRLLIYTVGERIEIGLSHAGATIGIEIVLRARSRDFFVRDGTVEVIRQRDGSRHFFSWAAFRPPNLVFGVPQQITLEVPAGFLLEPRSPRRLNIAFQDRVLQEEIEGALSPLRERWSSKLRDAGIFPPPTAAGNDVEQKITIDELYDAFSKEADFIQAWTALQRSCYWQSGSYLATVIFNATEPDQALSLYVNLSSPKPIPIVFMRTQYLYFDKMLALGMQTSLSQIQSFKHLSRPRLSSWHAGSESPRSSIPFPRSTRR